MEDRWSALSALADPSRRALYGYVCRGDRPISREDAADATGLSRGLAAFHLDKLVDAGLLRARYAAPVGKPRGRGRTPKVYEPVGEGVSITIPERRYELLAEILADAVAEDPAHADTAALRHAEQRGQRLGTDLAAAGASLPGALRLLGFDPAAEATGTVLRNCPFRALAGRHVTLVCGINQAFLAGLLAGLSDNVPDGASAAGLRAVLEPRPDACCVRLVPGAAGASSLL